LKIKKPYFIFRFCCDFFAYERIEVWLLPNKTQKKKIPKYIAMSVDWKDPDHLFPLVKVACLNLATSKRDEEESPLSERLILLAKLIQNHPWFDVFVVQEVRPSGLLTVVQVINIIREILGAEWSYHDEAINNEDPECAHRTIFWNRVKLVHVYSEVIVSNSVKKHNLMEQRQDKPTQKPIDNPCILSWIPDKPPNQLLLTGLGNILYAPKYTLYPCVQRQQHVMLKFEPYENKLLPYSNSIIVKSHFHRVGHVSNEPEFNIMNVHAPVSKYRKKQYWINVAKNISPTSIVLGDMNKFEADLDFYYQLFETKNRHDLIKPNQLTFVSFNGDRQPEHGPKPGALWRSSLDAVIINPIYLEGCVQITSTEEPPRLSDHFFISAQIYYVG
jgi:hypothetical protein